MLHCDVVESRTAFGTSVLNPSVSCYIKCASSPSVVFSCLMGSARKLFDEMGEKDEFSSTTVITRYVKNDAAAREIFDGITVKLGVAWNALISGYICIKVCTWNRWICSRKCVYRVPNWMSSRIQVS
ncbi:Pentatricopeptide repeat (PPR) superfamily protein [Euphorbia peplus]|nr:Pentatricopeptide repeat (PPR) superfamily protein [Euphorbia peplus]